MWLSNPEVVAMQILNLPTNTPCFGWPPTTMSHVDEKWASARPRLQLHFPSLEAERSLFLIATLVTTSKAPVTTSVAPVTSSKYFSYLFI